MASGSVVLPPSERIIRWASCTRANSFDFQVRTCNGFSRLPNWYHFGKCNFNGARLPNGELRCTLRQCTLLHTHIIAHPFRRNFVRLFDCPCGCPSIWSVRCRPFLSLLDVVCCIRIIISIYRVRAVLCQRAAGYTKVLRCEREKRTRTIYSVFTARVASKAANRAQHAKNNFAHFGLNLIGANGFCNGNGWYWRKSSRVSATADDNSDDNDVNNGECDWCLWIIVLLDSYIVCIVYYISGCECESVHVVIVNKYKTR